MMENTGIEHMDSKTLNEAMDEEKLTVVMFYSPKCPHCLSMLPIFEEIHEEIGEKALFGKVNVMTQQQITSLYGIESVPTFKFFCKKENIGEMKGEIYPALLRRTIKDMIRYHEDCGFKKTPLKALDGYA